MVLLLTAQLPRPAIEILPVAHEALGSEQSAQQLAAVVGVGDEELLELALCQQDDLTELVSVQSHHLVEAPLDVPDLGFERLPITVDPLVQLRCRLDGGRALAAVFRAKIACAAREAVARSSDGELQAHKAGLVGVEEVGPDAHFRAAFVARHGAEQGETDRVQDGGLASSGAPGDQEDPVAVEGVEVDSLRIAEGPKAGDGYVVDPHASTCPFAYSATTSRTSSVSSPVEPSPLRTFARNPSINSWSLRPRTSSV